MTDFLLGVVLGVPFAGFFFLLGVTLEHIHEKLHDVRSGEKDG